MQQSDTMQSCIVDAADPAEAAEDVEVGVSVDVCEDFAQGKEC